MSLFVRVNVGFYTHRKTLRLKARLGNDALWIPPRLWSYAAENQPDGEFEGYSPAEIAQLIGYTGDATSMLQALLQAGFLDEEPLRIHDWDDHNSYHVTFAERARKAAEARWQKKKEPKKKSTGEEIEKRREEKRREETSIATSMLQASDATEQCLLRADEPPRQSDSKPSFIDRLKLNPAYSGIDVDREFHKMTAWCESHRKQPTERRFINWLNNCDKPISPSTRNPKQKDHEKW